MKKMVTILVFMMAVAAMSFAATMKLDLAKQKKLDTFFSNFSEANVESFAQGALTDQAMLDFALRHLYINSFKSLKLSKDKNSVNATTQQVDTATMKYFGQKIKQHKEKSYSIPCADGEMFYFSQLDSIDDLGNKTFKATGTVYSTGSGGTPDVHGKPADWAKADEDVSVNGKFSAVIKSEGDRYILVEYTLADAGDSEDQAAASPEPAKSEDKSQKDPWAVTAPEKVAKLRLRCAEETDYPDEEGWMLIRVAMSAKHLPPALGSFINLKELEISGLESLEDLPVEIGNLKELESLVIDNGNGSMMNISLPESIGNLTKLKVLNLYGAMDAPAFADTNPELAKVKKLPLALAKLQKLETLELGRNRISEVSAQVASLSSLVSLGLCYSTIKELPEFVGNLANLKNLDINSIGGTKLPDSLKNLKGLNISMGNATLSLKDQEALRTRFPDATFEFSNEYDDDSDDANEQVPDETSDDKEVTED